MNDFEKSSETLHDSEKCYAMFDKKIIPYLYDKNDNVWFSAVHALKALEYKNTKQYVLDMVDKNDKLYMNSLISFENYNEHKEVLGKYKKDRVFINELGFIH